MNLLNVLGISDAIAQTAGTAPEATTQGSLLSMLPMLILFILVFYFLLIRPQNKRAKEQRTLISNLKEGDEVVLNSGMLGKIIKISDDYVTVNIADNVNVNVQKFAISGTVPKGTIKAI
jgi:preprotein translocase subunit YajC